MTAYERSRIKEFLGNIGCDGKFTTTHADSTKRFAAERDFSSRAQLDTLKDRSASLIDFVLILNCEAACAMSEFLDHVMAIRFNSASAL